MKKFFFIFAFLLLTQKSILFCKKILVQASSSVKQTSFKIREGEVLFTEKFQNINGKISEEWIVNSESISKDEYFEKILEAEKEEVEILREEEIKKKAEAEKKRKEALLKKKREEEEFFKVTRIQTLKRLINLEVEKVESSFAELDKYGLQEYFLYTQDTFANEEEFVRARYNLLGKAKKLSISNINEVNEKKLKKVFSKVEVLPDKIEKFFKQSARFATTKCNDTKKLKDFLTIIS